MKNREEQEEKEHVEWMKLLDSQFPVLSDDERAMIEEAEFDELAEAGFFVPRSD